MGYKRPESKIQFVDDKIYYDALETKPCLSAEDELAKQEWSKCLRERFKLKYSKEDPLPRGAKVVRSNISGGYRCFNGYVSTRAVKSEAVNCPVVINDSGTIKKEDTFYDSTYSNGIFLRGRETSTFSKHTFINCEIEEGVFYGCTFKNCKVGSGVFWRCTIEDSVIQSAQTYRCVMSNSIISGSFFSIATLNYCELKDVFIINSENINMSIIKGHSLDNCCINDCKIYDGTIKSSDINGSELLNTDVSDCTLEVTNMTNGVFNIGSAYGCVMNDVHWIEGTFKSGQWVKGTDRNGTRRGFNDGPDKWDFADFVGVSKNRQIGVNLG